MRKNKMMRTAAVLGVATMLTASVLSGTFAKYTTTAEGTDSARVAKWGITMGNNGTSTFSNSYDGKATSGGKTVTGTNSAKVVAPGTHGGATYIVNGAPETAYEITFKGTATDDVFLKKGLTFEYKASADSANQDATYTAPKKETLKDDYYPVNYSVKISSTATASDAKTPTLSAVNSSNDSLTLNQESTFETLSGAMAALTNTVAKYDTPNTDAALKVEFKWAWAFDTTDTTDTTEDNVIAVTNGHTSNDAYDTVLGDLTTETKNANLTVTPATSEGDDKNYSTEIGYKLSMTATQID